VANMNPRVGMVRLFLGSLGAFSLITLFLVAPAGAASGRLGREVVLLRSPARVKAVFTEGVGPWSFEIQIAHAGRTESVSTTLVEATYPDAVKHLRKAVAWRKPYLFVVSECGGGTDWACEMEHVFRIEGGRFTKLGSFIVGEDEEEETQETEGTEEAEKPEEPEEAEEKELVAATSYDHGYFLDLYDKLQDSAHLSHADAPRFQVALRDRNGHLAVDPEETWRRNRDEVLDLLADEEFPDRSCVELGDTGCVAPFVEALAIALYCGKEDVAGQIVAKAGGALIRWDERLDDVKKQVCPGELPAEWRKHHSWGDDGIGECP
jgi:hypothetical protein